MALNLPTLMGGNVPSDSWCLNLDELLKGHKQMVANALNLLENRSPSLSDQVSRLLNFLSQNAKPYSHVIGVTGPPGVGKSSLIARIIPIYRRQKKSVGIISIDPSSRKSGGAILADRTRITHDPKDNGVFIRSMATGQFLGGLSLKTRHCLTLFEAIFDRTIIETVGVGQSETEIEDVSDTVVFVVQPASGDMLQFMKSGIMEIPHILVLNKTDLEPLAQKTQNELAAFASLGDLNPKGRRPVLIPVSALQSRGQGKLVAAIEYHRQRLEQDHNMARRRDQRRIVWAYRLYREQFGNFGVQALGGREAIYRCLKTEKITNPIEASKRLEKLMWKYILRTHKIPEGSN
ncbi:hypothetical protein N9C84_03705 [Desulfobacterales bacterium]|nr:hypothetical protein [Desulfobacterales bacterium]